MRYPIVWILNVMWHNMYLELCRVWFETLPGAVVQGANRTAQAWSLRRASLRTAVRVCFPEGWL